MIERATALIEEERSEEQSESAVYAGHDSQIGNQLDEAIQLDRIQDEPLEAQPSAVSVGIEGQREEKARRWMWGFLIALGAVQIYFVQALLAALFLFTLVFAVFAAIAIALYMANRASQASLERVEPIARVAARAGRRTYGFIEHVSKKPFRRPHSETAR